MPHRIAASRALVVKPARAVEAARIRLRNNRTLNKCQRDQGQFQSDRIHPNHRRKANRLKSHKRPQLSRLIRLEALIQTPIINIEILRKKTITQPLITPMQTKHQTQQVAIKDRAATGSAIGLDIIKKGIARYLARSLAWCEFDASSPSSMLLAAAQRFTVSLPIACLSAIHHAAPELSQSPIFAVQHLYTLPVESRHLRELHRKNHPLSTVRGIAEMLSTATTPDSPNMTEDYSLQQVTRNWSIIQTICPPIGSSNMSSPEAIILEDTIVLQLNRKEN